MGATASACWLVIGAAALVPCSSPCTPGEARAASALGREAALLVGGDALPLAGVVVAARERVAVGVVAGVQRVHVVADLNRRIAASGTVCRRARRGISTCSRRRKQLSSWHRRCPSALPGMSLENMTAALRRQAGKQNMFCRPFVHVAPQERVLQAQLQAPCKLAPPACARAPRRGDHRRLTAVWHAGGHAAKGQDRGRRWSLSLHSSKLAVRARGARLPRALTAA